MQNPDRTWSYRFRTPSGQRPKRGPFATKSEAQKALTHELSLLGSARYTGERLTFDQLVVRFLDSYDAQPATVKGMEYCLSMFSREYGSLQLGKISAEHIALWRKGVSAGSQHKAHACVRQVLDFAIRIGCIHENPAKLVKNKQPPKKEAKFFADWEQVKRVGEELAPLYSAIPVVVAGTGLRPQEWSALRWSDVDKSGLTVRRTITQMGGVRECGKTDGSMRRVPIRRVVREVLEGLDRSHELVFPSPTGTFIDMHNFRSRHWRSAVEAAGFRGMKLYALRHSYAAWSLAAGVQLFELSRRMGTSLEMISKTYGHLLEEADAQVIERLDLYDEDRF